jgi:hypothetical protein
LKGRLTVDFGRYGGDRNIWMLFPECPFRPDQRRAWFLVPHKLPFDRMKQRHGHAPKWKGAWSVRSISVDQRAFLKGYEVMPPG